MMIDLSTVLFIILGVYILAGIAVLIGGVLLLRLAVSRRVRWIKALRAWARRAISKERMAEAGLVAATVILSGYVGAVLYHVTHTEWVRAF